MKTLKTCILIFGMAMLYASCAKDGATGPAGPTGPTGATGKNANVIDSTFIVPQASWLASTHYSYINITDPQITANIVANGEVIGYWGTNGTSWDALGWSSENPTGYILDFNYSLGLLGFYFSPGSDPNTVFGGTVVYFRIACITNAAMKQHPNTNWKNYNEVKAIIDHQNSLKN